MLHPFGPEGSRDHGRAPDRENFHTVSLFTGKRRRHHSANKTSLLTRDGKNFGGMLYKVCLGGVRLKAYSVFKEHKPPVSEI